MDARLVSLSRSGKLLRVYIPPVHIALQQKMLYAAKQQNELEMAEGIPMLTYREMDHLPKGDRAVNRASHDYYQALLKGASDQELQRLLQTWLGEIHKRWPDLLSQDTNQSSTLPRREKS